MDIIITKIILAGATHCQYKGNTQTTLMNTRRVTEYVRTSHGCDMISYSRNAVPMKGNNRCLHTSDCTRNDALKCPQELYCK